MSGEDDKPNLFQLDEYRIRAAHVFEDEQVAYLEVLWGKSTWAFNAAIRNLEELRRGSGDKSLRPPQTSWEAAHVVLYVRALANDLARFWALDDLIRPEDDLGARGDQQVQGPPARLLFVQETALGARERVEPVVILTADADRQPIDGEFGVPAMVAGRSYTNHGDSVGRSGHDFSDSFHLFLWDPHIAPPPCCP